MGWSGYLVDKRNKIQFEIFKTTEDDFLEAVNSVLEALKKNYEIHENEEFSTYDIQTKKAQDLTVKDMNIISQCLEISSSLNRPLDELLAAMYYIYTTRLMLKNEEILSLDSRFDFYTDSNEKKCKKYKDYKLVTCYANEEDIDFDEIEINPEWMDHIEKGAHLGKPREVNLEDLEEE